MSTSVLKLTEDLRNRMSTIIGKYTDRMKFHCFFHILLALMCITVHMVVGLVCFYLILYIMYPYCYVYIFPSPHNLSHTSCCHAACGPCYT